MAGVLAPALVVAAAVLVVAGVAKLRSPDSARVALVTLGWPVPNAAIRGLAVAEIALGVWTAVHPGRLLAAAVACMYLGFAAVALLLARRRASCGCFGDAGAPASAIQAALSLALAVLVATAAVWPAHGLPWLLGHGPGYATVLILALGATVYALVLAYTVLPQTWLSWSGS